MQLITHPWLWGPDLGYKYENPETSISFNKLILWKNYLVWPKLDVIVNLKKSINL
jgi:hypothetical protein